MLDSYEAERRPIALDVLRGTDLVTRAVLLRNPFLESLRNRIASFLSEFDFVQQRIAVGLSELGVNYRKSPIVAENRRAAIGFHNFPGPRAGDHVPDVRLDPGANGGRRGCSICCGARLITCCYSRVTNLRRISERSWSTWRERSVTGLIWIGCSL
jgi:hypothetical protein